MIINESQQAFRTAAVLLLLCDLGFPLLLTGLGNLLFYHQAQGSTVKINGVVIDYKHIGQEFTAPCYPHPRPSAYHYNTYYKREDATQYYNDDTEFGDN